MTDAGAATDLVDERLRPEAVAAVRRRAWRVLGWVATPVSIAVVGLAAGIGEWWIASFGLGSSLVLGGGAAALVVTPTILRAFQHTAAVAGRDRRRTRRLLRAVRRDRPETLSAEELDRAVRLARSRLLTQQLTWPSAVVLLGVSLMQLTTLLGTPAPATGWQVTAAVVALVVCPLVVAGNLWERRWLRRFLDGPDGVPESAAGR